MDEVTYYRVYITEHTQEGDKHYTFDFMSEESARRYRDATNADPSGRLTVSDNIDLIESK